METNKSIIKNLKLKNSSANNKTENSQRFRWYEDTLFCYNRHFDCLGCKLFKLTSGKCRLKGFVQNLLLKGIYPPKKNEGCFPGMTSSEILVTKAIYEGHVTHEQISNYTGLSEPSVQSILSPLYSLAEINGLNFKEGKMLPQLVKFLLKRKDESMAKHEIYYDSDLDLNYSETYKPLISAIKSGYTGYSDLEDKTDIKRGTLSFQFFAFADFLIKGGFISNTTGKSKRELVIDFIQSRLIKIHEAESDSNGKELSGKENPGCYIEKLTETEEKVTPTSKPTDTQDTQNTQVLQDKIAKKLEKEILSEIEFLRSKLKSLELLKNLLEQEDNTGITFLLTFLEKMKG